MTEHTIVIEARTGSKGRCFIAYFKNFGSNNPKVGYGVGKKPQDAVAGLLQHEFGTALLWEGGSFKVRIEWADPVQEKSWREWIGS